MLHPERGSLGCLFPSTVNSFPQEPARPRESTDDPTKSMDVIHIEYPRLNLANVGIRIYFNLVDGEKGTAPKAHRPSANQVPLTHSVQG